MQVTAYLDFHGRCEEALEFYGKALGAQTVLVSRFGDSPDKSMMTPGTENKIMHATFRIGATTLMASDGRCTGEGGFKGISLTLDPPTIPEAERLFAALADGGQVMMPLTKTFWSPGFGMLTDRFGISWMISVTA
ncbi:MAG: VOC family protein [Gemmataceae bacterium]